MRPGQNKRMRGRNNNNNGGHRRGPNPLTRSYESNGPDVKIRGTAQHIGEKYLQLARDAQTSGDPVAAENYLQHAEHYFRIIAAAQQAQQQAQAGYQRQPGEVEADEGDEDELMMPDRFSLPSERFAAQQQQNAGTGPQPYPERGGFNGERQNGNGQERYDRSQQGGENGGYRAERPEQDQRQNREPRQDYRQDNRGERQDYRQDRDQRQDRGERQEREPRQDREQRQDRDQRPYAERGNYDRNNGERQQGERNFRNDRGPRNQRYAREGQDYRGDRDARYAQGGDQPQPVAEVVAPEPAAELPAFITAPVRPVSAPVPEVSEAPVSAPQVAAAPAAVEPAAPEAAEGEAFTVRPRRRRRTRAMIEAEAAAAAAAEGGEPPASE